MNKRSHHILNLLFFTIVFLLLASVSAYAQVADTASTAMGPQSMFNTHGRVAEEQLSVFWWTVYVSAFLLVTVGAVFFYAVFKFKAKPGQDFKVPEQSHGSTTLEVGLIIASCVLLLFIAVPNAKALFFMEAPPEAERANAFKVVAIGHQWWWEFQYPESGVVSANELHIPVNRPIEVEIRSADVLHSFWVPQLAGKMDAVPGQVSTMWLDALEPGKYSGQCTEYCGDSHANMRFDVFAHEDGEFQAWLKKEGKDAVKPETIAEVNGQNIFMQGCNSCHAIKGTNAVGVVGPNLSHFASRKTIGALMFENNDENLFQWIKHPQEIKPGNLMNLRKANMNLTDKDIKDLVAYLKKLK